MIPELTLSQGPSTGSRSTLRSVGMTTPATTQIMVHAPIKTPIVIRVKRCMPLKVVNERFQIAMQQLAAILGSSKVLKLTANTIQCTYIVEVYM